MQLPAAAILVARVLVAAAFLVAPVVGLAAEPAGCAASLRQLLQLVPLAAAATAAVDAAATAAVELHQLTQPESLLLAVVRVALAAIPLSFTLGPKVSCECWGLG